MDTQQILILIGFVIVFGAMMIWPQFQARRRREKKLAALKVGDEIMTVGGIIGKLIDIDTEENVARLEIAPGVKIQIVLTAISQSRGSESTPSSTDGS